MTATGVRDPAGAGVTAVEFYADTDGNGGFDKRIDMQIGADRSPRKGWSLPIDTTNFGAGTRAFFARVRNTAGDVSKPAIATVQIKKPASKHSYLGTYTGEVRFSDGFVDVVKMRVTGENGGYLSGTFDQVTAGYSFTFTATILSHSRISIVFGGDGSGTGDGTISTDLNTFSGNFASLVNGKHYKGTFRVTKA